MQSYFPNAEAERILWLANYRAKIATHGPAVGLATSEITEIQADIDRYVWVVQTWHPAAQQYLKAATQFKAQLASGDGPAPLPALTAGGREPPERPAGVLTRLFAQIARLKTHSGYTETIGHDLGVIASGTGPDPAWPDFSAKVETGAACQVVRINFIKHGHDGVWIECRRNGGSFEFLAIDTVKPYLDDRPLLAPATAETREYRLRWWDKGEANGEWSPVRSLAVGA